MKFLFLFFLISSFCSFPIDSDISHTSDTKSEGEGSVLYDDSIDDGNSILIDNFFDFEEFVFTRNRVQEAVSEIFNSGVYELYYPKDNHEIENIKGIIRSDISKGIESLEKASIKTCNFLLAWALVFKQWDIMEFLLKKEGVDRSLMHALLRTLPIELKEYVSDRLRISPV